MRQSSETEATQFLSILKLKEEQLFPVIKARIFLMGHWQQLDARQELMRYVDKVGQLSPLTNTYNAERSFIMNKKDLAIYPAIFEYADDGITITFPDLTGCISCAESQEEALYIAKDVLGVFITACESLGDAIPAPSNGSNIKTEPGQSVFMIDAWLPIYREEKRAGSVKKNVTVPVWLNSLAEKQNLNFSQVLQAGLKASLGIQDK